MISQRRERSKQYHRDQFIGAFVAAVCEAARLHNFGELPEPTRLTVERASQILAKGEMLHRLAVQQCNGEGYYNYNRSAGYVACPTCCDEEIPTTAVVGRAGAKECITCRVKRQIEQLLPEGWRVRFQGDPRGYVCYVAYAPDKYMHWDAARDRWFVTTAPGCDADSLDQPRWLGVA